MLGFTDRDKAEDAFESIKALRDRLAHSQDLVEGTTWQELVGTVSAVNEMLIHTEQSLH